MPDAEPGRDPHPPGVTPGAVAEGEPEPVMPPAPGGYRSDEADGTGPGEAVPMVPPDVADPALASGAAASGPHEGPSEAHEPHAGLHEPALAPPVEPAGLAPTLGAGAMDVLLRQARSQTRWTERPVSDETLHELYDLLRWGPTSANCSPARFAFLRTPEARERLRPALSAGNLPKTLSAPVVVIVAHDPEFFEQLPRLFPHADARAWFAGSEALAEETAFRNGTLQGAYLLMAARGLGLGTCPMSGFDRERVDEIFFAHSRWRSNFLVALGHGDPEGLYPRSPRLEFDEACVLL